MDTTNTTRQAANNAVAKSRQSIVCGVAAGKDLPSLIKSLTWSLPPLDALVSVLVLVLVWVSARSMGAQSKGDARGAIWLDDLVTLHTYPLLAWLTANN
ncbi:hypothetical protein ACLKA6_006311 [Drosophila palustris]